MICDLRRALSTMAVKDLNTLRSDIVAAMPDNTSGLIGADDVRDTGFIDTIDSLEAAGVAVDNVAALRALNVGNANLGTQRQIKGHTSFGLGAGTFLLDNTGTIGANQDNNGTILHATGGPPVTDPGAWYWVRIEDGNGDDVQVWGAVVGTNPANAVANDTAIANMIAADQDLRFDGPVVISKTILLDNRPLRIYSNNDPTKNGAGGILVSGTDTAQSAAIIRIINNRGHVIDNLRFYGHVDSQNAASTKCALGIQIQSDTTQPVQYLASHWIISNCVFEREVANSTPFDVFANFNKCIEIGALGANANGDQSIITNCRFRNWTDICIDFDNTQAVNVEIHHCMLDTQIGQGVNYQSAVGIRARADTQVLNCTFNRMGTVIQPSASAHVVVRDFHIENANQMSNAASESCSVTFRDGKFIWQENAYTGATGIWLRFLNGQCLRVICDNVWFADQTNAATRPHMILASRATGSQGRSLFSFTNCRGITLDDIDAEASVGVPTQQLRRLSENDKGTDFRWQSNDDWLIVVDRALDKNRLNLD